MTTTSAVTKPRRDGKKHNEQTTTSDNTLFEPHRRQVVTRPQHRGARGLAAPREDELYARSDTQFIILFSRQPPSARKALAPDRMA